MRVRQELAPPRDHPRSVLEDCEDCGESFQRWKGERRHRCPECAAVRAVKAQDSMAGRTGEVYERAVRGQLAHWTAEAQRLGLL